tara:strand:- start:509 stop:1057 length:549 start_codon:yes stop_codon:yes gene_type:complete
MKKILLLSGGLDSGYILSSLEEPVYALTFDYGQRHKIEIEYARKLALSFGVIEHKIVTIDLPFDSALTGVDVVSDLPPIVSNRNAIFLSVAAGYAESLGCRDIYMGANASDYEDFVDCRPVVLNRLAAAFPYKLNIHTPLSEMTKAEVVSACFATNFDLSKTMSCYNGTNCGVCDACRQRNV